VEETDSGSTSGRSKGKRQHAPDFTGTGDMVIVAKKRELREKMRMKNDRDEVGDKRKTKRSGL